MSITKKITLESNGIHYLSLFNVFVSINVDDTIYYLYKYHNRDVPN